MKLVVFGLTVSTSWGNGHATLWRGLIRALARQRHEVVFFERDLPFYAQHRDLWELPAPCRLVLFPDWSAVRALARAELADADAAVVTSYCPDARAACREVWDTPRALKVFYDLDTPVTLERLRAGEPVDYLPREGLGAFDRVLSFTGGPALRELTARLGAREAVPLYGSVDPDVHRPAPAQPHYRADLSYLGTYAANRQRALDALFLSPAAASPERRFLLGGAQYPSDFAWQPNVYFVHHLPPSEHPAFFCSSRLTLNVTRAPMATVGYCPSGRMFEAAACGAPLLTDAWPGLAAFFEPGRELLVARSTRDVLDALSRTDRDLRAIGAAARQRALGEHSAGVRARELVALLERPRAPSPAAQHEEQVLCGE